MKPMEYLEKLNNDVMNATNDHDFAYRQGLFNGARRMWEIMRLKQNEYREQHREEVRKYNREYARARRAKRKEMENDLDKIANMK